MPISLKLLALVRQQADNVSDEVAEPQENERDPIFAQEPIEQEEAFEMTM